MAGLSVRYRWQVLSLVLLPCLLLSACVSGPQNLARLAESRQAFAAIVADSSAGFGPRPAIEEPAQLHYLEPAQLAAFHEFLDAPSRSGVPLHQRVYDYLENLTGQFAYYEETLPASAALEQLSGNCMSLAVLTTALAQAAGLDIGYRLMEDVPVFEYQGTMVIKGVHLSTILYRADWMSASSDWGPSRRPGLQVDYFRSARTTMIANADRADYLAMYYQNIAVENLERGELNQAYWYAREALQHRPLHTQAINTLAVLYRRKGDLDAAQELYRFGIDNTRDNLGLLRNYLALLEYTQQHDKARGIARQLERKDEASPFRWISLAYEAEQDGDYDKAIHYYEKALSLAPYMHEVQLNIALANYRSGKLQRAAHALDDAIALVPAQATRSRYEAKRRLLSQELPD